MSRELVVAHYQEDLNWLNDIIYDFPNLKITIYHKDPVHTQYIDKTNNYHLDNVGREAHTYLHHVISNYNTLSDFTIFCQGKPYDHISKETLYSYIMNCNLFEPSNQGIFYQPYIKFAQSGVPGVQCSGGNYGDWWRKIFGTNCTGGKQVWSAHFVVHNSLITSKPVEFYTNAIQTVNKDINPEAAQFFERTWGSIFT